VNRRTPNAAAEATKAVAVLHDQAASLKAEIVLLRGEMATLQADRARLSPDLVEANRALVLSVLQAETVAESAQGELDELTRSSQRDVLTGTPNRGLMLDRLESAIAQSRRRGTRLALLFVDLDRFKQINDSFGHSMGDTVLRLVSRRMESVVRESDTVSRHGGDEFLVLLTEVSHPTDAALIAAKMLLSIAAPGPEGVPELSASIGVALYPDDGVEAAALIGVADAAMYRSKERGRGGFAFRQDLVGHESPVLTP